MSDFTSTYRLRIDTIDTYSTQKSKENIGIFVEVPKNLTLGVGDTIEFTGKIVPLLELPFTGFERYVWKEDVYGRLHLPVFSRISEGSPSFFLGMQARSEESIFRGFPRDVASIIL